MKNIIVVCIMVCLLSCDQKNKFNENKEYDLYSITLSLSNRNVLYLRLNENTDSLLLIKQSFNDTLTEKRMLKLTPEELLKFKEVVLQHLQIDILNKSSSITHEGQAVTFLVSQDMKNLSSKFSNLDKFKEVSDDFNNFIEHLKSKHQEINKYML
jgi:hypothetical protein